MQASLGNEQAYKQINRKRYIPKGDERFRISLGISSTPSSRKSYFMAQGAVRPDMLVARRLQCQDIAEWSRGPAIPEARVMAPKKKKGGGQEEKKSQTKV